MIHESDGTPLERVAAKMPCIVLADALLELDARAADAIGAVGAAQDVDVSTRSLCSPLLCAPSLFYPMQVLHVMTRAPC